LPDSIDNILEDCKEDFDEETYQKAIRAAWEEHDAQVESLQKEQDVSTSFASL